MRLTVLSHVLFFAATDRVHGRELWTSDGTPSGTSLVGDLDPGKASSYPGAFTVVDGNLFFRARDPADGTELWELAP
jgi:ELWxxDGT repeat protein